jgi:hypothetical protein
LVLTPLRLAKPLRPALSSLLGSKPGSLREVSCNVVYCQEVSATPEGEKNNDPKEAKLKTVE